MKQFAFPLSVKCADDDWSKCAAIFRAIGYDSVYVTPIGNFTDWFENGMIVRSIISDDTYHIGHFNPNLIRDIAAACTNDTWQEDELINDFGTIRQHDGSLSRDKKLVCNTIYNRPTLAEICAHHGYEIKGRDIVKKVETVSNCDKSYCETARQLDEAKSEIKRLKYENDDLREKLEAMTDVDNHELARLRSKIDDLEDINAVITKELKCTQDKATGKIDELANKLQYNDKLHVKELEMLTDMITELSRDKAELITKLNCLSAPAGIFHTSRPLEFRPINLPYMFQTKPAEFSEREKKRLLRLAERIEKLIK